ncbi:MAG: hypothetical protein BRD23_06430 [Halobacteriales archaeon SW_9_67_25]|nr:MAG: hypothetical protein BRD23_06430 [Halobacteriales archaeon SW_9_67_25]
MGKVSIGLRGWRFDEEDVFDEDGEIRGLEEMPADTRHRIVRLSSLMGEPCNACWLLYGEDDIEQCNPGTIVYGEPLAEVLLCGDHEADFLYWFRELGGEEFAGSGVLADEFHEWFLDGGRAPDGYGGLDHVQRHPDALPNGADPTESESIDEVERQLDEMADAEREALDVDLDDLDV